MAGHSKWANIKHRKAGQDAKRGKLFTKVIREISVAAKIGGADPASNPSLRTAIDKALGANMKRDTIDNTIKKATGAMDGVNYEEVHYEGYGPGGIAVIVDCLTDNRNRTVGEVRHAFSKAGGNLGTDGSVAYLFDKKGQINFEPGADEERIMEVSIEAGAEDVDSNEDGSVDVLTSPEDFHKVKDALVAAGLEPANAEVAMIASTYSPLDKDMGEKVMGLIDALEDLDDVTNVYTNADFPDDMELDS